MKFGIVIPFDRRKIRLQVELISDNGSIAKYKVIARNGAYVLKTNKPLLISKGLKYKPAEWKIAHGGEIRKSLLEITNEIEKKLNLFCKNCRGSHTAYHSLRCDILSMQIG